MVKVQILTQCEQCSGQAYLPAGEGEDKMGQKYPCFSPCPHCAGSGVQPKWVSLSEFIKLLQPTQCPHAHTSYQGGMHFIESEPWDDIHEVCIDCGARID